MAYQPYPAPAVAPILTLVDIIRSAGFEARAKEFSKCAWTVVGMGLSLKPGEPDEVLVGAAMPDDPHEIAAALAQLDELRITDEAPAINEPGGRGIETLLALLTPWLLKLLFSEKR